MNAFEIITKKVIEAIEKDNILPWKKPWKRYEGTSSLPKNLVTRKDYNGVNILLLAMQGFASPYWLTYKQATTLGGHIKRGETGTPIVYWNIVEFKGKLADKTEKKAFIKYSFVFNVEQCQGIQAPQLREVKLSEPERIERCDQIVEGYIDRPVIEEMEPQAFYNPRTDKINMPHRGSFNSSQDWYSVLFHELGHSTGSESRLCRKGITDNQRFGSESYSKEELIAELTASFLCAEAGIEGETTKNSVSYLKGWLDAIRGDARLLIQASAQAQKATDYILGRKGKAGSNKEDETE